MHNCDASHECAGLRAGFLGNDLPRLVQEGNPTKVGIRRRITELLPGLKGGRAATILPMAPSAGIASGDAEGIDVGPSGGSGAGPSAGIGLAGTGGGGDVAGVGGVFVPMFGRSTGEDPYLWLEEVDGADALAWVEERNRATRAALAEDPGFVSLQKRLRALFDAEDRIPWVRKRGTGTTTSNRTRSTRGGLCAAPRSRSTATRRPTGRSCSTSTRAGCSARFDAEGLAVAQHWATRYSADGTPIVPTSRSRAMRRRPRAGPGHFRRPTLLRGAPPPYGGFEVSETPWYAPAVGAAWLEPGGVFAVANIRGGGEFGPAWHRAAVRSGRRRACEDFIAVAEDLVRRGVTTPSRLGIIGASNGGLLMGNMLTMRPDPLRRHRRPGASLRHAPLPPAARRRELDGRVR